MPMAPRIVEAWRIDYSLYRPHASLGRLTPNEFAIRSRPDHNQNGFWLSTGQSGGKVTSDVWLLPRHNAITALCQTERSPP